MLRYLTYLAIYIPVQLFAYLITPVLPLFAVKRMGNTDNNRYQSVEWRLPIWLAYFDTPDNCIYGDDNWYKSHKANYFSAVGWLYRNSLYGFKWSVLSTTIDDQVVFDGNPKVSHHGPVYGLLRGSCGKYWQYKRVQHLFGDYCLVLNLGWLLDNVTNGQAHFMISPRLKKVQRG